MKMTKNTLRKIREELSDTQVTYKRAVELRAQLEMYSDNNYKPRTKPLQVLEFIKKYGNGLQLRKVHPQDYRTPYVWMLFTPKSAWVVGDSAAECLDKAVKTKQDWTAVSTTQVNQLILAHESVVDARELISKNVKVSEDAEEAAA